MKRTPLDAVRVVRERDVALAEQSVAVAQQRMRLGQEDLERARVTHRFHEDVTHTLKQDESVANAQGRGVEEMALGWRYLGRRKRESEALGEAVERADSLAKELEVELAAARDALASAHQNREIAERTVDHLARGARVAAERRSENDADELTTLRQVGDKRSGE